MGKKVYGVCFFGGNILAWSLLEHFVNITLSLVPLFWVVDEKKISQSLCKA